MEIKRSGSQPSAKGSVQFFTGDVRIDRSSRWSSRASPEFPPVRVSVRARRLAIMPGWLSIHA